MVDREAPDAPSPAAEVADSHRFDVAVVGLGPVGQATALLLAQQGHRVLGIDKHPEPYALPRAVRFTDETARLLDWLGVADYVTEFSTPTDVYEWQNAARQTLLRFNEAIAGPQGWPEASMFNQPGLEHRLRVRGDAFANFTVLRDAALTEFSDRGDDVTLIVSQGGRNESYRARYLIAADGAQSFVRGALGIEVEDLGFKYDWLVIDTLPKVERVWEPENLQICDPDRPVTLVSSGPGRRRFEFMRMPSDDVQTFDREENAWRLLALHGVTPDTVDIERLALYTFQAKWAKEWRRGRVLLAGDAVHQVPPFYGQGMVAGLRDTANLGWKLDLVLRGLAGDALLDTYVSERIAHVQHTIWMSVELGRIICETAPEQVAARDARFLADGPDPRNALPEAPPARLGPGFFPGGAPAEHTTAGLIAVGGRVQRDGGEAHLLDQEGYGGFTLIVDAAALSESTVDRVRAAFPTDLALAVARLRPAGSALTPGSSEALDLDERYLPWLQSHGIVAALVRPDFYVYGVAETEDATVALAASLTEALAVTR